MAGSALTVGLSADGGDGWTGLRGRTSLGLQAGDEILTTNHEHSGGNSPMAQIRDRHVVVITRVALPVGNRQRSEDYVELFRRAITTKTKVMLFSAPTYKTGTMLPIQLLAKLAQQHGLTTVVDAALVPGMMNYRFRELGVDFLAGSTAEWHCGPGGTGVLYARNKVLPQFNRTRCRSSGRPSPAATPTRAFRRGVRRRPRRTTSAST
jgi:selenocysteine lyase/cysteine desulfurase